MLNFAHFSEAGLHISDISSERGYQKRNLTPPAEIQSLITKVRTIPCNPCWNIRPYSEILFIIWPHHPPIGEHIICIWRSVRSCSHTIPEKVINSRPMNMGFKGWGCLLWWSWVTFKPFRYKKFNERVQKANFSVLSRICQELCAENPKNKENKRN